MNEIGSTPGLVWTFRTADPPPAPPAPPMPVAPEDASVVPATEVSFAWTSADEPDDGTAFELRIAAGGAPLQPAVAGVRGREIQVFDLDPGAEYEWQVVARNAGGAAASPDVWSFSTAELPRFRRGLVDPDSVTDVTDPIFLLTALFLGTAEIGCPKSADVNDDSQVDVTDPIYLLGFLFLGTAPPLPPRTECGVDPSDDGLSCEDPPGCSG